MCASQVWPHRLELPPHDIAARNRQHGRRLDGEPRDNTRQQDGTEEPVSVPGLPPHLLRYPAL